MLSDLPVSPLKVIVPPFVVPHTEGVAVVVVPPTEGVAHEQTLVNKGSDTVKQPVKVEILVPVASVGVTAAVLSYVSTYMT